MNTLLTLTARTLIEHSIGRSENEVAAACDAVLEFLRKHGTSPMQLRRFVTTVRRELRAGHQLASAVLTTPSGSAGESAKAITSSLERMLATRVELSECADRDLLGGALLAVGDERIDRSLRGALTALQIHLQSPASVFR